MWPIIQQVASVTGEHKTQLICPAAPIRYVTTHQMHLPAWYDIFSWSREAAFDHTGCQQSVTAVSRWIDSLALTAVKPTCVLGFSQGAVMALVYDLATGCRQVVMCSGYLPPLDWSAVTEPLAILWQHGSQDEVLPIALAEQGQRALASKPCQVTYQVYAQGHQISVPQLVRLIDWCRQQQEKG